MIISQNSNDVYYAYTRGRFWRWDESARVWKESHLLTQKFGKAKAAEKHLTPEAFLTSDEFIPMDDYELPEQMLTALREAKPCKNAPIEPVEEEPECTPAQNADAAVTTAENAVPTATAATPTTSESGADANASTPATSLQNCESVPSENADSSSVAPAVQSMTATEAVTFDFGADDQTNALLLQDAQTFITGNMARIMAAKHAHDLTANHYQGSWGKWCAAVGISRDTGDRMVSVAAQCGNIQLEGKSILDVQPLKLLYAAAKPSTPEVVKQAVFTGDITTYKEYQELMAQLKAEKDRADKAEARAKNAEDALKKQPIVGVTDPEEVRRQADALAAEAKAQARRQIEDAQRRTREAEARYQKLQQDADGFLAPEQSCAQQAKIIADSMRSMYLGWFGLASTTGTPLARMAAPIYQVCDEIRESLEEDTTINPTAEGSVEDAEREALFE